MADLLADARAEAERLGHELGIKNVKGPVSWSVFAAMIAGLKTTILDQQRRITELERRTGPEIRYVGVWSQGFQARAGNFTTFKGSVWCATEDTQSRPGEDSTWVLAVKCGRDGRDAR